MAWGEQTRGSLQSLLSRTSQAAQQQQANKRGKLAQGVGIGGTVLGGLASLIPGVGPLIGGAIKGVSSAVSSGIQGNAQGAAQGGMNAMNFIGRLTQHFNPYSNTPQFGVGPGI